MSVWLAPLEVAQYTLPSLEPIPSQSQLPLRHWFVHEKLVQSLVLTIGWSGLVQLWLDEKACGETLSALIATVEVALSGASSSAAYWPLKPRKV